MAGSVVVYDAYDHVARVEDVPGDVFSMMSGVIGGCVDCVDDDSFGSRGLDLWVSDSGDSGVLPYAFTVIVDGSGVPLFGNVVFTMCGDDGSVVGLGDDEIVFVMGIIDPVVRGW